MHNFWNEEQILTNEYFKKKKQLLNIKQRKKRKHHLHLQSAQLI